MSITTSSEIKNISAALRGFQNSVHGVGRDSNNPAFKSKYASLENVIETIRGTMSQLGLVFIQSGGAIVDGTMAMSTRIIHAESGEWIEGNMDIMLGKRDPQGTGSAQTYAQRYHLMAMLGLPPVDDDGEAAIDRENKRPIAIAATGKPVQGDEDAEPQMSKQVARGHYTVISMALRECKTLTQLQNKWQAHGGVVRQMPDDWRELLIEEKNTKKAELEDAAKGVKFNPLTPPVTDPPKAATPNFDNLAPNDIDPKAERLAKIGNTP